MKRIFLLFSLLVMYAAIWVTPARSNESTLTQPEQQAALRVIIDFLILNSRSISGDPSSVLTPAVPGNGQGSNQVVTGSGIGTNGLNGIEITFAGPGGREILVRTTTGNLLFNLTKISPSGAELNAGSEQWSCLRDNLTGLVWEIKTTDGGLHDQEASFAWYNTDKATNGGINGFADNSGATCVGYIAGDPSTYCNTEAFVARVNTNGWCGYRNWRMPTIEELAKIVSLNKAAPTLYTGLFPRGTGKAVWSASPVPNYPGFAWHIYLNDGYAHGNDRSGNLPVLLVRSVQP
jgi:hypothetical protein